MCAPLLRPGISVGGVHEASQLLRFIYFVCFYSPHDVIPKSIYFFLELDDREPE